MKTSQRGLRRRAAWFRQGLSLTDASRGRTKPVAGLVLCAPLRGFHLPPLYAEKFPLRIFLMNLPHISSL